jgi:hypothetical protein
VGCAVDISPRHDHQTHTAIFSLSQWDDGWGDIPGFSDAVCRT